LFKSYGEHVPEGDCNPPGTKQGIYMMGPNGEYLEGAHAASGSASRLLKRMKRALERWESLKAEEKYAGLPVPRGAAVAPPEVNEAPLALRVSLRDLPRGEGDNSGRRRTEKDLKGQPWMKFTEWAWNQNWLTLAEPEHLVPEGKKEQPVPDETLLRIVRQALVDNVRGQNPAWKAEDVKEANLNMRAVRRKGSEVHIEYAGAARMDDGNKRFAPELRGRAVWNRKTRTFESFRLVAIGERAGAASFNQRAKDKEPAPMGIALELHCLV